MKKSSNKLQDSVKKYVKNYCNPFWLPVIILFLIIPNIVYYKVYESRLADYAWTPQDSELAVDFYLYYKQFYFLLLIGAMLFLGIVLFTKYRKNLFHEKKQWLIWIPLGIYLVFSLLSAMFSPYREAAFTGSDQQFESVFVLLGYGIVCIYFSLLLREKEDTKKVVPLFYVAVGFWAVLGLCQSFSLNPFRAEWFQRLITPTGYLEAVGPIRGAFEEGYISLFSYNPNYAGILLSLCAVFCFVQLAMEKNKKNFLWKLIILIAVWMALLHTRSDAGILAAAGISLLMLICFTKPMKKLRYVVLGAGTLIVAVVVLLFCAGGNPVSDKLAAVLKNEPNPLSEMTTEEDGVHITYRNLSFVLTADYTLAENVENSVFIIHAKKESGEALPVVQNEDGGFTLNLDDFQNITLLPAMLNENIPVIILRLDGYDWYFLDYYGEYCLLNEYNNLELLKPIERVGFKGYEAFATARGLIWSQTLPLLKDSVVLGSGASSFAQVYPQNNYKDQVYFNGEVIATTRPHNFYLQAAVESGIPALLALLVFFSWYVVSSLKCYWNAEHGDKTSQLGLCCFLMVLAYLVCMLANDSMIVTAPVFWGILGVGIAVNRLVKAEHI